MLEETFVPATIIDHPVDHLFAHLDKSTLRQIYGVATTTQTTVTGGLF